MSRRNLRLSSTANSHVEYKTMEFLAEMWRDQKMYPTIWQRYRRWNRNKDSKQWLTSVLNNTPILPIFVHRVHVGGEEHYHIVDGQNRTYTMYQFLIEDSISIRAGDVLRYALKPNQQMKFSNFSEEQRNEMRLIRVPVCFFPQQISDDDLRFIFSNLNKGKNVTSQEIIRTWLHIPLVSDWINVVDTRVCEDIQEIQPRWRPKNHTMVHTWIRIAATVLNDDLHLGPSYERIQKWIANQQKRRITEDEIIKLDCIVDRTIQTLLTWSREGTVYALCVIPDIAWFHLHYRITDEMDLDMLQWLDRFPDFEKYWKGRTKASFNVDDVDNRRRSMFMALADKMGKHIELDMPIRVLRSWHDDAIVGNDDDSTVDSDEDEEI